MKKDSCRLGYLWLRFLWLIYLWLRYLWLEIRLYGKHIMTPHPKPQLEVERLKPPLITRIHPLYLYNLQRLGQVLDKSSAVPFHRIPRLPLARYLSAKLANREAKRNSLSPRRHAADMRYELPRLLFSHVPGLLLGLCYPRPPLLHVDREALAARQALLPLHPLPALLAERCDFVSNYGIVVVAVVVHCDKFGGLVRCRPEPAALAEGPTGGLHADVAFAGGGGGAGAWDGCWAAGLEYLGMVRCDGLLECLGEDVGSGLGRRGCLGIFELEGWWRASRGPEGWCCLRGSARWQWRGFMFMFMFWDGFGGTCDPSSE